MKPVGAQAILAAAAKLFAQEGFESVSVASIAEQAGVCKANVFHHFTSKDRLYLAVMKEASAPHADYAEELYRLPCSSVEKVRMLMDFEIRSKLENPQRTRLTMREVASGGHARVRKMARDVFHRNFTAVVNIFEQGRARGEFDPLIDSAAAAMMLSGAVMIYFNCRNALPEFREANQMNTPEAYAQRVATLVLSGVQAGGSAQRHRGGGGSKRAEGGHAGS